MHEFVVVKIGEPTRIDKWCSHFETPAYPVKASDLAKYDCLDCGRYNTTCPYDDNNYNGGMRDTTD